MPYEVRYIGHIVRSAVRRHNGLYQYFVCGFDPVLPTCGYYVFVRRKSRARAIQAVRRILSKYHRYRKR